MTYWADNIKFIKDILESKYKKIDDSIADVSAKKRKERLNFNSRFWRVMFCGWENNL